MSNSRGSIRALLFGLNEDLAGELLQPLSSLCSQIQSVARDSQSFAKVAESAAEIIFCPADTRIVSQLRQSKPHASIVVVSRHPEVSDWLDSIEAGATDYCAAPFETAQMKWILETNLRSIAMPISA